IRDFHVTGVQTCALPILMMFTPSLGVLAVWLLCHRGTPFREWARRTGLTLGPRRGTTVRAIALAWFGVPLLTVVAAAVSVALGKIGRASCRERVVGVGMC